jgi:cobalamin biosynthesis protein CobD/CbiB
MLNMKSTILLLAFLLAGTIASPVASLIPVILEGKVLMRLQRSLAERIDQDPPGVGIDQDPPTGP